MKYFSKKYGLPLLVLLIASLVVFWEWPHLPQKIAFDEVEFAKLALGLENNPTIYTSAATGHTTPYFYFILGSFKLFGVNVAALRLPAAIFGVLNPLMVFLILRECFKKNREALLGAVIFATLHWVFQFARYAFEATYLLFWELMAVYYLLRFRKTGNAGHLAMVLVGTIVSFYSYLPGRIFFLLPLLVLVLEKTKVKFIILYLSVFLLIALPLLAVTGTAENRVRELTYLNSDLPLVEKAGYLGENTIKNLLMLNFRGDLNGRHNYPGKPGLNILAGMLFWAGFLLSLKNRRKHFLFYLWAALSLAGTLLTYPQENPHFLRTYTLTVPLVYFMTYALSIIPVKNKRIGILVVFLVILSCVYEIRTYFKYQRKVFGKAFENQPSDLMKLKAPRQ